MKNIIYILSDSFLAKKISLKKLNKMHEPIGFDNIKEALSNIKTINETSKKINDEQLQKHIRHFEEVLEANFDSKDLQNFRNNIAWLKLKVKKLPFINIFCATQDLGLYDPKKNTITLKKHYGLASLFHELFHLASTNFGIGFHYTINKISIGEALNEGYTEYLIQKYFGIKDDENVYGTEKAIAIAVEKIIGSKKMESLYLNSNLLGLIDELENYYSEDEVEKFLISSDIILTYTSKRFITKYEFNEISKLYTENIYFLVNGFCQKLSQESDKDVKDQIIDFINSLVSEEVCDSIDVNFDINIINAIIETYLGEQNTISFIKQK